MRAPTWATVLTLLCVVLGSCVPRTHAQVVAFPSLRGTLTQRPLCDETSNGLVYGATDMQSPTDCTVGSGTATAFCICDGLGWVSAVAGLVGNLQSVGDAGAKYIGTQRLEWCDVSSNKEECVSIGAGQGGPTVQATIGGVLQTWQDVCRPGQTRSMILGNGAAGWTLNCDTGTVTYNNTLAARPTHTVWIPAGALAVSGTCNDAEATERTLVTNGPKRFSVIPADDNTCGVEFSLSMPLSWDGGTVSVVLDVFSTGNNTGEVFEMDCAAQCVRSGDSIAAHATTGEQAATCTWGNSSNREQQCMTPQITPNGTCAAGASLYGRCQVDATATTTSPISDVHILGLKLRYKVSSSSD